MKRRFKAKFNLVTLPIIAAMIFIGAFSWALPVFGQIKTVKAEEGDKKIYLSYSSDENGGVTVPAYALNSGCSNVKSGLELPENNKFLRIADFDGLNSEYAVVSIAVGSFATEKVNVLFSYRFSEGATVYARDEKVISVYYKNAEKTILYKDLATNDAFSYDWHTFSFELPVSKVTDGKAYFTFYHGKNASYQSTRAYFDIDDFKVISGGKNYCEVSSFDTLIVSDKDELDTDYSSAGIEKNKALMLDKSSRAYSVNTEYSGTYSTDFNVGTTAVKLPKGSGSDLYTDAASGSQFMIYNKAEDNSFIRMGKFDSTKDSPSVYMPFYNNDLGTQENMPLTNRVYITFKYRLFIDEDALDGIADNDVMLEFSTRRASLNNSGRITLDALTVNEQGDGTWHDQTVVLETNRSSTKYMIIVFYPHTESGFNTKTYFDIDSLYVTYAPGAQNYAYDMGEFENATNKAQTSSSPALPAFESGDTVMCAENEINSYVKMPAKSQFAINANFKGNTGTFDINLFAKVVAGDKLNVYLGGKNGVKFQLTAGSDVEDDYSTAIWTKKDGGYNLDMTAVTAFSGGLSKVVFENASDGEISIDDLFIGQVKSIEKTAGNKAVFDAEIEKIKNKDLSVYTKDAKKVIEKTLAKADKITENHSQKAMDEVLEKINAALSSAAEKADLTELNKTLATATAIMEDGKSYKKSTYMIFKEKYYAAKNLTENSTAADVEKANKELKVAMDNLVQTNYAAAAVAVSGISGVALCLAIVKRRAF